MAKRKQGKQQDTGKAAESPGVADAASMVSDAFPSEAEVEAERQDSDMALEGASLAAAMDHAESKARKRKRAAAASAEVSDAPQREEEGPAPSTEDAAEGQIVSERGAAALEDEESISWDDAAVLEALEAEELPDNVRNLFGADGATPPEELDDAVAADPVDEDSFALSPPGEDEGSGEPDGIEGLERLEGARLVSVIESLLFASDKLLTMADLKRMTGVRDGRKVQKALDELKDSRLDAGIILVEAAGSFRFQTNPRNADFVGKMVQGKPVRLSRAMMEALAIVAYKQPITRPEVDDIRGVDCGPVLKTLLERNLIRVIGKKEDVGRPLLYGTTPEFLKTFNLSDLTELPTLREFHELGAEESKKMKDTFGADEAPAGARASAEGPEADVTAAPETGAPPQPEVRVDGLKGDRPSAFSNNTIADVPEDDSLIEELERATEAATRALEAGKGEPGQTPS